MDQLIVLFCRVFIVEQLIENSVLVLLVYFIGFDFD